MRKLHRLLMAALVLVPLAACDEGDDVITPVEDPPAVGTVSGTVSVEGTGLAGVTVQLAGATSQSTTTGSNGSYSFANVVEGNYSVTLSGIPGDVVFSSTTTQVSIATDGQVASADFNGQYVRTASILVTVTRADGSGVVTNVRLQGEGVDQTLGTNAQGNVTFSGLKSGNYDASLVNPPEGFEGATTQNVAVNTGQAVQINFVGATEIVPPEIAIERITETATNNPVDPDSIVGRVDVTVNVKDNGNDLETIELWVLQKSSGNIYKIAEQRFAAVAPAAQDDDGDTDVTFSWNSDAIRMKDGSHPSIKIRNNGDFDAIGADAMRPFHPLFVNGDYEVHGRVTVAQFEEGFNAIVDVTLENQDAINLGVVSDNTDWADPTTGNPFPNFIIQGSTGLRWLSGDVIATVFPIIYSQEFDPNNPLLARANFSFDAFVVGTDVNIGGAELPAPNADGTFTFTFCEAGGATSTAGAACYASINDVNTSLIGARNIIVQTKTAFGQFGPGFNAGANVNNIKSIEFFNEDLQSGTGVLNDVLRIDNESPTAGSMNPFLNHPANAISGVSGFSRTTIGGANNLGWVAWGDVLTGQVNASPDDQPFVFPAGGPWTGYDANLTFTAGQMMIGIGNPAGAPNLSYISGPDNSAGTVSTVISGATLVQDVITGADLPPETDSPGLTDAGSAAGTPFSDTEIDFAMAARHWDLFGNWTNTSNFILFGVDGRSPIYSDALGTTDPNASLDLIDPVTTATTMYNTFDDEFYDLDVFNTLTFGNAVWNTADAADPDYSADANFQVGKAAGVYTGFTTDRGNGFSGVAGVVVEDFEQGCGTGELACFNTTTTRYGFTLQPGGGGASVVLPFTFDGETDLVPPGVDTFSDDGTDPIHAGVTFWAFVAAKDTPATADGYRDHNMWTWDRAGNYRIDMEPTEHNDDHDAPNVGNVQMPTAVTYDFVNPLTFNGENLDNVDMKKTDFTFDFNSILSLQLFADRGAASHTNQLGPIPPADTQGNFFEETSLQLPLKNVAHTNFGSASIYLGGTLTINTTFLGCLVRADELGLATVASANDATHGDVGPVEPYMHVPRGPRWRTWDHSSAYGLVNTQFNTFVPTSIPTCQTPAAVGAGFVPALGLVGPNPDGADATPGTQDDEYGWIFNLDANGMPRVTFKGQAGTFVPNVGPSDIIVYYLDTAGRAILVDNPVWSLIVSDLGTGAFGRWYEYTLAGGDFLDADNNGIPDDLIDIGSAGYTAQTNPGDTQGWFIVVTGNQANTLAGHGVIWDITAN
ncbi:MAG: carboxypeptidase regulatory-like domain-containing protein [Gemmatimonadetes bacterium]|nr:carboxypeptidase regulatory-like domain-containing protein [Gemmatimonadota bacterium]